MPWLDPSPRRELSRASELVARRGAGPEIGRDELLDVRLLPRADPLHQAEPQEDAQVLLDTEIGEDPARFGNDEHAPAEALMRGKHRDVLAVEEYVTARRLDDAGGDVAQRRLAGAVRSEQRHDRPGGNVDAHAVEHVELAVPRRDVLDRERGRRARRRLGTVAGAGGRRS